jgi:FHS family L-fucose permease-like MFS transporter
MNHKPRLIPKGMWIPYCLVASCFAWWGFANCITDPLVKVFKDIYDNLSHTESALIQFAFYAAYFCLAIPGGIINRKFSYKHGILTGLGISMMGCFLFYPASLSNNFYTFLVAFYVLASGLAVLETAASPYILSMGDARTATQRLNLAGAFVPTGSIVGVLISKFFVLGKLEQLPQENGGLSAELIQADQLSIVISPYLVAGFVLILVWLLMLFTRIQKTADGGGSAARQLDFVPVVKRLLGNSNYLYAVVAQFFYVGVQISVWTFTIHYVTEQLNIKGSEALNYQTAALVAFMVARFICTALMSKMRPSTLLLIMALAGVVCCLTVIFVGGTIGVYALVSISACMSLMFPTIFGLGTKGLGEDIQLGSSGLIMAILGGALIPLVQARLVDISSVSVSYVVPMVCFLMIAGFAIFSHRIPATEEAV